MGIKSIPLSRLEADLAMTLNECVEQGQVFVVELPNQQLVTIQPTEDDWLTDELLELNPRFQAMIAKSKASPRKSFSDGR